MAIFLLFFSYVFIIFIQTKNHFVCLVEDEEDDESGEDSIEDDDQSDTGNITQEN